MPRSSGAPAQPTQRLSPSCPEDSPGSESALLAARRGQLRGEGASVCASAAGKPGGREETRARAGGAGAGAARREGGGAWRLRGSPPGDLRLGHIAQAEALGPVDLAHFLAAPTLLAGSSRRRRPARRRDSSHQPRPGASTAVLAAPPAGPRSPRPQAGRAAVPRALGWRSEALPGLGGGDNKAGGAGRAGREVRPLARAA